MEFAGHPTVGTAFVLLQEGIVPRSSTGFVLEEKVGPVPVRIEGRDRPLVWLRTPTIREGRHYDASLCAEVLGLEPNDLLPTRPQMNLAEFFLWPNWPANCSEPGWSLNALQRSEHGHNSTCNRLEEGVVRD